MRYGKMFGFIMLAAIALTSAMANAGVTINLDENFAVVASSIPNAEQAMFRVAQEGLADGWVDMTANPVSSSSWKSSGTLRAFANKEMMRVDLPFSVKFIYKGKADGQWREEAKFFEPLLSAVNLTVSNGETVRANQNVVAYLDYSIFPVFPDSMEVVAYFSDGGVVRSAGWYVNHYDLADPSRFGGSVPASDFFRANNLFLFRENQVADSIVFKMLFSSFYYQSPGDYGLRPYEVVTKVTNLSIRGNRNLPQMEVGGESLTYADNEFFRTGYVGRVTLLENNGSLPLYLQENEDGIEQVELRRNGHCVLYSSGGLERFLIAHLPLLESGGTDTILARVEDGYGSGDVSNFIDPKAENPVQTAYVTSTYCFVVKYPARKVSGVDENGPVPAQFALQPNYPNPFNPETEIRYELPKAGEVTLNVYDVSGRLVKTLVKNRVEAGTHVAKWDGANELGAPMPSGLYIYRIVAGQNVATRKMNLIR